MNNLKTLVICLLLYVLALFILPRWFVGFIFFFHVVLVPLLFKYSTTFRRKLVFANFVQWPFRVNYDKPMFYGVRGARNFYIEHNSKADNCRIKIGVWHILPQSSYQELRLLLQGKPDDRDALMDDNLCNSKKPIMMYCHGNANSRATPHRIRLYQRLQEMNFHVIAFDYRGFGDSTNIALTELGVVEDALVTYKWIIDMIVPVKDKPRVFIWGHSLGSGIASHLLGNLEYLSEIVFDSNLLPLPSGLILEAPFNNMADEVKHHPLSLLVRWLPYRINTFVNPFKQQLTFCSDLYLRKVRGLPVLIMHGKDDMVVPYILGVKLYRSILSSRSEKDAPITFKTYESGSKVGHIWICTADDLNTTILEFCNTQCKQTEIRQNGFIK